MKMKKSGKLFTRLILGILLTAFVFGLVSTGAEAAFDSPLVDIICTFDENGIPYNHWTIREDFPWEHQKTGSFTIFYT